MTVTNSITRAAIAGVEDEAESEDEGEAAVASRKPWLQPARPTSVRSGRDALLAMLAGGLMVEASPATCGRSKVGGDPRERCACLL